MEEKLFEFLKWASQPLFVHFRLLYKQTVQYLQQINAEKCPSSKRYWD